MLETFTTPSAFKHSILSRNPSIGRRRRLLSPCPPLTSTRPRWCLATPVRPHPTHPSNPLAGHWEASRTDGRTHDGQVARCARSSRRASATRRGASSGSGWPRLSRSWASTRSPTRPSTPSAPTSSSATRPSRLLPMRRSACGTTSWRTSTPSRRTPRLLRVSSTSARPLALVRGLTNNKSSPPGRMPG